MAGSSSTARFCLRCGDRLHTVSEDGRRRQRCPACGWTFYGNPVPAAVALVEQRRRLLLTLRGRAPYADTWDLPGGFLEADETAEQALARELREELGLRVRRARFVTTAHDRYGLGGVPVVALVYRVTDLSGAMRVADDVAAARWFPLEQVPYRAVGFPSMRRLLRAWVRERLSGR